MASVINFQDFKEGTREKYADYIQQLLDEASDIYEDIIIDLEERKENTKADVEFIFGEYHLEDSQKDWTAMCIDMDEIFNKYRTKYSQDKDYLKLYEEYKSLEIEFKDLFEEYL